MPSSRARQASTWSRRPSSRAQVCAHAAERILGLEVDLDLDGAHGRVLLGDTEEDRGGAALGRLPAVDVGTTKPSQPSKHALPLRLSSRRFMMNLLCTTRPFSLAAR